MIIGLQNVGVARILNSLLELALPQPAGDLRRRHEGTCGRQREARVASEAPQAEPLLTSLTLTPTMFSCATQRAKGSPVSGPLHLCALCCDCFPTTLTRLLLL